ncbi:hypothetical protein GCM10010400_73560 [Streptomyces aculeolatus]
MDEAEFERHHAVPDEDGDPVRSGGGGIHFGAGHGTILSCGVNPAIRGHCAARNDHGKRPPWKILTGFWTGSSAERCRSLGFRTPPPSRRRRGSEIRGRAAADTSRCHLRLRRLQARALQGTGAPAREGPHIT